jgi:hypothetical protein
MVYMVVTNPYVLASAGTRFYAILGVICLGFTLVYGYVWLGPRGKTINPTKLARYRWSTLVGLGLSAIILVRLLTHTYR